MNWTHDGLADDLAAHLRGNTDRMVWADMQLGPSGSSRPDVYALPKTYSRFQPIAYECKVSMSDFRSDVTKGKYTDYLAFASGVVFACPAGLLKKEDIPNGAGLMVRGPDGWRSLKKPTLVKCESLPHDAWMKLLIDGSRRDLERQELQKDRAWRSLNEYQALAKIRAKFGDIVAAAVDDHLRQTTGRLDSLKYQIARETAALEFDLKRIEERRQATRQQTDEQCSKMLTDLAAAVGMEPVPGEIFEMSMRLRKMIALAQRDSTIKELREVVEKMRWGVDRFREMEAILDAVQHGIKEAA